MVILTIPYMPFGFIASRFWLSHLGPLVLLLPDFGYPVQALLKGSKQDSQNLGAIKQKGLNTIAKIWEQ
jgi:hypothetical protein